MAKPTIAIVPTREPLDTAGGLRETPLDIDPKTGMTQKDLGSAKSIGARRAAAIKSPTRDIKVSRLYIRQV